MRTLKGYDFYHGNKDDIFNSVLENKDTKFIILKASEGKTFKDSAFIRRAQAVNAHGIKLGAYHYCRPENGNSVEEEMDNFIARMDLSGIPKFIRPFLDVEGSAVNYADWVKEAMEYMVVKGYDDIGIYCSLSAAKGKLINLANKYPLWIAHYNDNDSEGCIHFDGEIITQYKSTLYDYDVWDIDKLPFDQWCKADKEGQVVINPFEVTAGEKKLIKALREQGIEL